MRRTEPLQSLTARVFAILLSRTSVAAAQDLTEPDLKAAFIYNFAKFTEWPPDAVVTGAPLVFCVLGDAAISEALGQLVEGRTLAGHRISVSRREPGGPLNGCHIAYLSRLTAGQAAQVVTSLRDAPVLTMSDAEGFTQQGGMAQFFFEHGQLRFNVHLASARRAGLQISSKLLVLATLK